MDFKNMQNIKLGKLLLITSVACAIGVGPVYADNAPTGATPPPKPVNARPSANTKPAKPKQKATKKAPKCDSCETQGQGTVDIPDPVDLNDD